MTEIVDDDDDNGAHDNHETKEQLEHDKRCQLRTQALVVVQQSVYLNNKMQL